MGKEGERREKSWHRKSVDPHPWYFLMLIQVKPWDFLLSLCLFWGWIRELRGLLRLVLV